MNLSDRLIYALIGALFGALMGAACWWLYGLGLSVQRPIAMGGGLPQWVGWGSGAFAAIGFMLGDRASEVVGNAISGVFHVESHNSWSWGALLLLASLTAILFFSRSI